MGREIERKFLIANQEWRKEAGSGVRMKQAYVTPSGITVRVRIAGNQAFLTLKGKPSGLARSEFEYAIPVADAEAMISEFAVSPPVEKIRYTFPAGNGLFWEVDEYFGANAPLFTAEIELPDAATAFVRPAWLGAEVSGDGRYTNRSLSKFPYSTWALGGSGNGK